MAWIASKVVSFFQQIKTVIDFSYKIRHDFGILRKLN